jgi:hypothetical protein
MAYKEIQKSLLMLVILTVIAAGMIYLVISVIKAQGQQKHIDEMNIYCSNLSSYINIIKNNYTECMSLYNDTIICDNSSTGQTFSCYFAECPTQSEYLNEKTSSLCVCDITSESQTFTLCVRKVT